MKDAPVQNNTIVKIRGGRSATIALDAWKYWEIVGEIVWRGANRLDALDVAKRVARAKPGERFSIEPGIDLIVERKRE